MTLQENLVDYDDGGLACRGLIIRDATQAAPQPGVVMFPDARGIGETAKAYARRLAGHGYVVFIADLYGRGLFAADLPRARELMTALRSDVGRWRERRSGADLAAIVSLHGGLASPRPQDAANLKGRVLACHGGADPLVSPAQVTEFVSHMNRAPVDWELQVYARALHGFTNPELARSAPHGHGYDAQADQRSRRAMIELLDEVFGR
jgi:dienelactone hydrolase